MKQLKSKKGITLIALVVTIVVLLILASISIGMLTGEDGIINQAKEAKEQTEIGEEKEKVEISSVSAAGKDKWGNITKDNLKEELDKNIGAGDYTLEGEGPFIVTYNDSKRSYVVDANGNIISKEEYESKALKFLVNSGEDGIVYMPIPINGYGQYQIDWGDGTTGIDKTLTGDNGVKVASLDNKFVAAQPADAIGHTYAEKNKEYIVTITEKCYYIGTSYYKCTPEKIVEVLQWGETGLTDIDLSDCNNLRKIASPTENSFINVDDFRATFAGCTSLMSIPENLFANCPNVYEFRWTFDNCTSLTTIPENLFANCPNVTNFQGTFYECTGLTGVSIPLWERVKNGNSNDYIGIPDGVTCYYKCEGLEDYNSIPEYWKQPSR